MLISLDKNKWLYNWLQEKYQDELYNMVTSGGIEVPRPNELRAKLVQLLNSKGHKAKLTSKFDAVKFVKVGSEIIGGKGGGGRKDFAQAGGQDQSKIEEAFEKLKSLV